MSDNQPPPPPSAKNETKGAITAEHAIRSGPEVSDPTLGRQRSERDRRIENRALFIQSMTDPARRRTAFDVVERNCRDVFGQGEEGLDLFLELAADVRRAKVEEAVIEFDSRFAPMLDQRIAKRKLQQPR
jgi:hypothetical protein